MPQKVSGMISRHDFEDSDLKIQIRKVTFKGYFMTFFVPKWCCLAKYLLSFHLTSIGIKAEKNIQNPGILKWVKMGEVTSYLL